MHRRSKAVRRCAECGLSYHPWRGRLLVEQEEGRRHLLSSKLTGA
jgi:hypothetical protein